MSKSGIAIGTAAEYFTAAELTRRGFNASVTIKNTPGIDIIAVYPKTEKMSCIQVKAKLQLGKRKEWILSKNDEQVKGDNYFYVFLNLNTLSQPDFYIIPSKIVAAKIKNDHKLYLEKGKKDNPVRTFRLSDDDAKKYQNWDILK